MTGNTITITGNLTRDPELRFTPSGQATTSFGIAVNRRWLNRDEGTWEESTSFFDVVAWRELAENATQSLARGTRVTVTGRLEQRSWETPEGQKRSKVEINASDIATSLAWATAKVTKNERQAPEPASVNDDHEPAF
ncbi:MAG: single-stranded DNA-binding protein [Acidimicrobiales bacterium]